MSQAVLNKILDGKIIAIVRGIPSEKIVDLVNAMLKGGVYCVEVTFDQSSEEAKKDTLKAISTITKEFGDKVCVGAGTVMTVEQVHQAQKRQDDRRKGRHRRADKAPTHFLQHAVSSSA